MNLTFKTDFWDQPILRTELIRFVKQIHNLDLTLWDQKGYWDRNYQPFAYFDGDRMVANACLFTMDMRVNGKDCKVAQISGVGTDPEYRNKGLAYELDQKAIEWAREKHDFFICLLIPRLLGFMKNVVLGELLNISPGSRLRAVSQQVILENLIQITKMIWI